MCTGSMSVAHKRRVRGASCILTGSKHWFLDSEYGFTRFFRSRIRESVQCQLRRYEDEIIGAWFAATLTRLLGKHA
jgi:hypothetical protein